MASILRLVRSPGQEACIAIASFAALYVVVFIWWIGYYRTSVYRFPLDCIVLTFNRSLDYYASSKSVDVFILSMNCTAVAYVNSGVSHNSIDPNTVVAGGNVSCLMNTCYGPFAAESWAATAGCTADLVGSNIYAPIIIGNAYAWQNLCIIWSVAIGIVVLAVVSFLAIRNPCSAPAPTQV